jgi:hypothetical protein
MPELADEQLDSLRTDIAANGVLVPVVVDQHGRILDGNHRAAIAAELGIDYPTVTVTVVDDDDAWDKAVSLNCARRHLTREQTREVIKGEIRRTDDSDRAIARRVGCSPSTVGSVRAEVHAEFVELDQKLRAEVHRVRGMIAMRAQLRHRDNREPWQTVGDVLERAYWIQVSNLDTDRGFWNEADGVTAWKYMWGQFFDVVRSYDCPADCTVCTPEQRAWRDAHPKQVFRWADVSNLDTEAVGNV